MLLGDESDTCLKYTSCLDAFNVIKISHPGLSWQRPRSIDLTRKWTSEATAGTCLGKEESGRTWNSSGSDTGACEIKAAGPHKFIGFGAIDVTKPYSFLWSGDVDGPKPNEVKRFRRLLFRKQR